MQHNYVGVVSKSSMFKFVLKIHFSHCETPMQHTGTVNATLEEDHPRIILAMVCENALTSLTAKILKISQYTSLWNRHNPRT